MARIAVVLGGAWNVWQDLKEAEALLDGLEYEVAAVNEAGRDYKGRLSYWCSLHMEKMQGWQAGRRGNQDYIAVSRQPRVGARIDVVFPERFAGSSGSYVIQVLVLHYRFDRIVVCGVPMTEEGHYFDNDAWRAATQYRRPWREMAEQGEFRGKIRSMSGWTESLVGRPTREWLLGGAD